MKQIKITNQTTSDSFTFYDNAQDTILRSFDGFEYAEVKLALDDVSGDPGATYVTSSFGRRNLSFQGDLVGSTIFSDRRDLLKVMRQTGEMKLFEITTYDDLQLRFEAEIRRFINPYTHQVHTFLFELVAPDYRFYEQAEQSQNFAANTTANAVVGGIESTHPLFTITGPGNNIAIQNNATGLFINIGNLIGGDVVVVDTQKKTVTKNSNPAFSIFTGDFFMFEPGNNNLTFSVASASTGATNLNVKFRNAYNGL